MKAKIINRIAPCNCGCKGSDSQHAAKFERTLRDVADAAGTAKTADGWMAYTKTAVAKFHWGTSRVVYCPWPWLPSRGDWYVDIDNKYEVMAGQVSR